MTIDLVKRLRNPEWVKNWFDQAGFQAADRIEELEATQSDLVRAALEWAQGKADCGCADGECAARELGNDFCYREGAFNLWEASRDPEIIAAIVARVTEGK